jgi:MoaA/NifB/PqqE/SkfB family radical SAM enzyme
MQQQPVVDRAASPLDLDIRPQQPPAQRAWRFSDIVKLPGIAERFDKVRKYFFLRESTYDMTRRCNIRCDGCYYYEGEKQHAKDVVQVEPWRELMRAEKQRGITFVVLAGAEPALVPDLLQACYDEIPLGCIATNGIKLIPPSVGYRVHISVWGNDTTSERTRKAKRMLERQIDNYRGDPRAVFVYTFTRDNIDESREVVAKLASQGCLTTFNMFSAPVGYSGTLRHTPESLRATRDTMLQLVREHPQHVLFSAYNAVAHSHPSALHALYACPYPRANEGRFGLGRSFRQFRSDLTWVREASCCVPDTDCADCRHYAAGSAVVTSRMNRHAADPQHFKAWLDYVDTYLAVWVTGYHKGVNLCDEPVAPPGFDLDLASPSAGTAR